MDRFCLLLPLCSDGVDELVKGERVADCLLQSFPQVVHFLLVDAALHHCLKESVEFAFEDRVIVGEGVGSGEFGQVGRAELERTVGVFGFDVGEDLAVGGMGGSGGGGRERVD